MHLKRDTEYALRILCGLEEHCKKKAKYRNGMSLYDICVKTGVPRISASRVCGMLSRSELIQVISSGNDSIKYKPGKEIETMSLLSVIQVIEGHDDIFFVFDKKSDFMQRNHGLLEVIKTEVNHTLDLVFMSDFFKSFSSSEKGL